MRVKNWYKFQAYKHRRPPWLKLHRDLIEKREWIELDGEAAKLLVSLWILAAEKEGELPDTENIAWRLRMSEAETARCLGLLSAFIEDAPCCAIKDAASAKTPEAKESVTTTTKKPAVKGVKDLVAAGVDVGHAADWLRVRREKRAPLTATAWDALCREADHAGITPAQAVQMCAERGWQSYQARYGRPETSMALETGNFGKSGKL